MIQAVIPSEILVIVSMQLNDQQQGGIATLTQLSGACLPPQLSIMCFFKDQNERAICPALGGFH